MTTESEYINLVDYVAELRSKLQHARTRDVNMRQHLLTLMSCDAPMIEITLWRDAMEDHERFIENLETQLSEYEEFIGWR